MAAVMCYRKTSDEFSITCGVRQGCVPAPMLIKLYFDVTIHSALEKGQLQGRRVRVVEYLHDALEDNHRKLQHEADLEYADDMALVTESWD